MKTAVEWLCEKYHLKKDIEIVKQETLEEAAREYYKRGQLGFEKASDTERAFLNGAKWQQERSYSEEEVIELLQKALTHKDDGETGSLVTAQGQIRTANFHSWFNKFKKK